jgi:hypothetical protein
MSKKSKRRARAAEAALAVDPPVERAPMWGSQFVDSIRLSDEQLNTVFIGWFLTALLVFGLGNVFLSDAPVLAASGKVTLVCLGFIAVAYSLSRVCGHPLIGVLLTMVAAWGFTYARQGWLVPVVWVVGAAAAGYCVRHIRVKPRTLVLMLLAAAITAVMSMGCPKNFTTFDMIPRLNAGYVHMDTLYHAAMAAMIKNYGVASTGLHGVVEVPYHAFSHAVFAFISMVSGVSVVEVYGVVPWVLFAPMLIFGAATCAASVDRGGQLALPIVWAVASTIMVVFPATFEIWRWESFLPSESQTIGMGLFVLSLPMLLKRRVTTSDAATLLALAWVLPSCKGPVGFMLAGLWLSRWLLLPAMPRLALTPAVAGILVMVLVTNAKVTTEFVGNDAASIMPFHFISSYSWRGRSVGEVVATMRAGGPISLTQWSSALWVVLVFFAIHFSLSWVVLLTGVLSDGIKALWSWPILLISACATAACCLFVCIIRMPFMNLFWFTSVTYFVAIPALASWAARVTGRQAPIQAALLIFCALTVTMVNQRGLSEWSANSLAGSARPGALQWVTAGASRAASQNELVSRLRSVRDSSDVTAVFTPRTDNSVGNHLTQCMAAAFIYPAVSERSWQGVIDLGSGCQYRGWGYEAYMSPDGRPGLREAVLPPDATLVLWP